MRFTRKSETPETELACRHTLVVHADGTAECEGEHRCGNDQLVHDWWLPCHELGCGCVGEEHDLVAGYAMAA